jgi:hypothetical protein
MGRGGAIVDALAFEAARAPGGLEGVLDHKAG